MSVDVANLALAMDSTDVTRGVGELDKLTAAGTKAEAAVDRLGDSSAQAGAQIKTASQAASDMAQRAQLAASASMTHATNVGKAGTASGVAAHHLQNLTFQANDLFVGLASGQKPMTVFMQQGMQIAQIMQQAGIGVGGLAKEVGGMAGRFAAAHPILVAVGLAAGAAGIGFKAMQESIDDDAATKKLVNSLGLTKKELKELKDTGVTAGDTFKGLWKTISDALGLGPIFETVKEWAKDAFSTALQYGKIAAAGIFAGFIGTFTTIKAVWQGLPGVIGEAVIGSANLTIRAVEGLINKAIQAFNGLLAPLNSVLTAAGLASIKPFAEVALPRMENAFAGSTARMKADISGSFSSAFGTAMKGMEAFGDAWERSTLAARDKRVRAAASEIIEDRPDRNGATARKEKVKALTDEEKAYLAAVKAAKQYLDSLTEETARIGKTAIEIKRLEVAAAAAKAPTEELKNAIKAAGEAWEAATKAQAASDFIKNTVEPLELQVRMLGESTRAQALATLEAEKEQIVLERGIDAWNRYHAARVAVIDNDFKTEQLEAFKSSLEELNNLAGEMDFSKAFGTAGSALNDMVDSMARLTTGQAEYAKAIKAAGGDQDKIATATAAKKKLEVNETFALIGATKSLFKEQSVGYQVLGAAEKAYAAIQAVNTIKNVAAGASKIFASLGPFGFPVVAAMVAVMAGLGFSGGSSTQTAPTSSEDLQNGAGTGSVLGDTAAKSASIANALEIVAANSNRDLEYSNAMLKALRSIDTSIGALAGNVARQISVSGSMFDTSKLRLGSTGSGGFLGIGASSTDRTLYDLGINLNSGTVANIIQQGIAGSTYQIVQQIRKTSGFLGIGGGTSTTYQTTTGAIDASITQSIGEVVASLRNGLVEAANVVGLQGAQALIDGFQINIGKISFAGMTGQEIEDQLNAIFSKVGDDMAATVMPGLAAMQKLGEGLFETFIRVAREYQVVDMALTSIGMEFGAVGVASLKARDELVQLFGTLDDFAEQTAFFRENFLTEAEQIAPVANAVREEMARLGLAGVATREQFKAAVLGLDLTTTAGQEMYAALMAVAPAFDRVATYAEAANKTMSDAFKKTVSEFQGYANTLTKYRDSLRAGPMSQGNAYEASRKAFLTTAGLAAEGSATGLAGLENAGKTFLEASKANATSLIAYQRDVALVAGAVDKGIFAATETADYAQLQLDALNNSASILASIDTGIANVQTLLGGSPSTPATVAAPSAVAAPAPAGTSNSETIAAESKTLIADQKALLMQMAESLSQMARQLSRWDGDGLLVRTDEDTPLDVSLTNTADTPVFVDQVP